MTFDLNKLINESHTPLDSLLAASRGLAKKWERTGLLEGLKNETEKGNMSVLLENQARQLVTENSKTSSGANQEQWSGVALPLVRKVFGEISAKEFVSVQPMNLPSGLLFYMDFTYGTAVAPRSVGQSVYGDTTSSVAPTGGLYGAGRQGYSINDVTASFAAVFAVSSSTSASTNFALSPAGLADVYIPVTSLPTVDLSAIRAFQPSGSGFTTYFPQFTKLSPDLSAVVFVVAGNSGSAAIAKVTYTTQPTADSRGDFEDRVGGSIPPNGVDLNIPEIDIQLRSIPIVAKTRKLKAVWTPELAQDLNAYHSIDAEAELTALLSEYVSLEIDLEILEMLLVNAQTTGHWSAIIGTKWDGANFVADTNLSAQAWTNMTWYQTLGQEMQRISNKIHQLTMRGGANFAVVSPNLATIIESIPGFVGKTDGNQATFAMGVAAVGSFQNRFQVYKNPYFTDNVMLMGFRGSNFLETGAVYSPYIPLIMTPLVYDPENFTPRRGVLTRYAKSMVRNEFFAKILVHGLQTS
jgi:major capsid protein Gp23